MSGFRSTSKKSSKSFFKKLASKLSDKSLYLGIKRRLFGDTNVSYIEKNRNNKELKEYFEDYFHFMGKQEISSKKASECLKKPIKIAKKYIIYLKRINFQYMA